MNWSGRQHPLEMLVEWLAPLLLAAAAGWAGHGAGLPVAASAGLALLLFAIGRGIMRLAGRSRVSPSLPFEPAGFEPVPLELDELLLEAKDELLELTDPLDTPPADSRVVKLFARQEPTPGELVERITDYLGEGQRAAAARAGQPSPAAVDASDALHAALANIRASLRQASS